MSKIKTLILRTAGTNCDLETAYAFEQAGSEVDRIHINAVAANRKILNKYQILAIPGGFTYGDDIASGKILANELKSRLREELSRFIGDGKLIIGICNGFQVLVKMGLLPNMSGKTDFAVDATLSLNDSGKFEDRWVHLKRPGNELCIWTQDLPEMIYVPVAHGEGKFIPKNISLLSALKDNGQIVFRYVDKFGGQAKYPENPNGSTDAIAGVCDPTGRILGMMPHPERHVSFLQHPHWRRLGKDAEGMGVGLQMFKSGVAYAKKTL
jgi:phosphoribosylformylglycinamidine synthase